MLSSHNLNSNVTVPTRWPEGDYLLLLFTNARRRGCRALFTVDHDGQLLCSYFTLSSAIDAHGVYLGIGTEESIGMRMFPKAAVLRLQG